MSKKTNPSGHGQKAETRRKPVSKRDAAIFQQYGFVPQGVEFDEFHQRYESYDWTQDPELRGRNTSVIENGQMRPQTRETLSLLATFGQAFSTDGGGMPMEHWARVTGYKEPTVEERRAADAYTKEQQFVLTSADYGNEELLTEMYGPPVVNNKMAVLPTVISQTPQMVEWSLFPGQQLLELPPFHFCQGAIPRDGWDELDGAMATLQDRVETPERWLQLLASSCSLKLYLQEVQLAGTAYRLLQHYSTGNRLFVASLFEVPSGQRTKRKLCKYFFIQPQPLETVIGNS